MEGILLVDKPTEWTSFDVVNYVRKMVAQAEGKKPKHVKVGHTGTLDPLATGLLVLLIGSAYTKRAPELTKLDKTYAVTMKLGETSTTGDSEGEKERVSIDEPSIDAVQAVLRRFTGELMQTPPVFSAVKINGQRAYALARAGQAVTLEPRPVTVYDTELEAYVYPEVSFVCKVSSGTYIRSLVEDMGRELKTGAYMSGLKRTQVGDFRLEDAVTVSDLDSEAIRDNVQKMA